MVDIQRLTRFWAPRRVFLPEDYSFDLELGRLFHEDHEVEIGGKTLRLIEYLCRHANTTVSPEALTRYIYGTVKETSTLRTLIFRLKQTLGIDLIHNVTGVGYKIQSAT
jgi:DNA-binding response OmpR family regulator